MTRDSTLRMKLRNIRLHNPNSQPPIQYQSSDFLIFSQKSWSKLDQLHEIRSEKPTATNENLHTARNYVLPRNETEPPPTMTNFIIC